MTQAELDALELEMAQWRDEFDSLIDSVSVSISCQELQEDFDEIAERTGMHRNTIRKYRENGMTRLKIWARATFNS